MAAEPAQQQAMAQVGPVLPLHGCVVRTQLQAKVGDEVLQIVGSGGVVLATDRGHAVAVGGETALPIGVAGEARIA